MKKYIVLFFAVLLVAFSGFGTPIGATSVSEGKAIFDSKCSICHGQDGKGNQAMSAIVRGDMTKLDLTDKDTAKKTDAELSQTILNGKNPMQPFKSQISTKDIQNLLKYIRNL